MAGASNGLRNIRRKACGHGLLLPVLASIADLKRAQNWNFANGGSNRFPRNQRSNAQGSSIMPLLRPISSLPAYDTYGNPFQVKVRVVPMTKALAKQWHEKVQPYLE
jgi:hypothetical protein